MAKAFVFIIAFLLCLPCFSQTTKEQRLKTSKRLNKTGKALLISGLVGTTAGVILAVDGSMSNANKSDETLTHEILVGGLLSIAGITALSASLSYFVRSKRAYKRAMSFSIKNEHYTSFQKGFFTKYYYPAFGVKINLNR